MQIQHLRIYDEINELITVREAVEMAYMAHIMKRVLRSFVRSFFLKQD